MSIVTDEGNRYPALNGLPWVMLDKETFFDQLGMLFVLWVAGHLEEDPGDEPLADAVLEIIEQFAAYSESDTE